MPAGDELRGFLARLLGWTSDRAIADALRSIEVASTQRAHLVLCGEGDLVPIAHALHRRTLGTDRPFVVCDPRRASVPASVRSPENHASGVEAVAAATGGSLCIRLRRLPHDFSSMAPQVRTADRLQYIVCSNEADVHPFLLVPAPIHVPSLSTRAGELPRIVDEYGVDAIAALGAHETCFGDAARAWVLEHAASSLPEIEKATLRLVALRTSANMSSAAERLKMAPVSLSRWIGRRRMPPTSPG
ncbi:MAG: hypothetical protein ABIY55_01640 [Kofleriaceae bacterium]